MACANSATSESRAVTGMTPGLATAVYSLHTDHRHLCAATLPRERPLTRWVWTMLSRQDVCLELDGETPRRQGGVAGLPVSKLSRGVIRLLGWPGINIPRSCTGIRCTLGISETFTPSSKVQCQPPIFPNHLDGRHYFVVRDHRGYFPDIVASSMCNWRARNGRIG